MIRQLKGLKHCKLLKRRAMKMFKATGYSKSEGVWRGCLQSAIDDHRVSLMTEAIHKKFQRHLQQQEQQELSFGEMGWMG